MISNAVVRPSAGVGFGGKVPTRKSGAVVDVEFPTGKQITRRLRGNIASATLPRRNIWWGLGP